MQAANLTAANVAGSPSAEQWRTAGQAGFATESRQGRPSQQADARPLPAPASSPTASTSGREVAELRQQVADLQAQNRQLLQMTRQQQATITLLQASSVRLTLYCGIQWPSQRSVATVLTGSDPTCTTQFPRLSLSQCLIWLYM